MKIEQIFNILGYFWLFVGFCLGYACARLRMWTGRYVDRKVAEALDEVPPPPIFYSGPAHAYHEDVIVNQRQMRTHVVIPGSDASLCGLSVKEHRMIGMDESCPPLYPFCSRCDQDASGHQALRRWTLRFM